MVARTEWRHAAQRACCWRRRGSFLLAAGSAVVSYVAQSRAEALVTGPALSAPGEDGQRPRRLLFVSGSIPLAAGTGRLLSRTPGPRSVGRSGRAPPQSCPFSPLLSFFSTAPPLSRDGVALVPRDARPGHRPRPGGRPGHGRPLHVSPARGRAHRWCLGPRRRSPHAAAIANAACRSRSDVPRSPLAGATRQQVATWRDDFSPLRSHAGSDGRQLAGTRELRKRPGPGGETIRGNGALS